ncbi:MAG: hypothetical protein IEMM0002_1123 [bacterium]|nr:MAG: hypothetical protein IEMM0002_1123 [bacterium]
MMFGNLKRLIGKIYYLVPAGYWNVAMGAVVAALLVGIGSSFFITSPSPHDESAEGDFLKGADREIPAMAQRKTVRPSPLIGQGNIFRKQRKDYEPPPPPPKPKKVKKENTVLPDIKLRGIIITGGSRIAILDSVITTYRQKVRKAEISGAKTQIRRVNGKDVDMIPVKTEKLKSQSYYEGDRISEFILNRVLEDRIEILNMANNRITVVHMEEEIPEPLSAAPMASKKDEKKKDVIKQAPADVNISGARTKN